MSLPSPGVSSDDRWGGRDFGPPPRHGRAPSPESPPLPCTGQESRVTLCIYICFLRVLYYGPSYPCDSTDHPTCRPPWSGPTSSPTPTSRTHLLPSPIHVTTQSSASPLPNLMCPSSSQKSSCPTPDWTSMYNSHP